jgi:hypothetical protein
MTIGEARPELANSPIAGVRLRVDPITKQVSMLDIAANAQAMHYELDPRLRMEAMSPYYTRQMIGALDPKTDPRVVDARLAGIRKAMLKDGFNENDAAALERQARAQAAQFDWLQPKTYELSDGTVVTLPMGEWVKYAAADADWKRMQASRRAEITAANELRAAEIKDARRFQMSMADVTAAEGISQMLMKQDFDVATLEAQIHYTKEKAAVLQKDLEENLSQERVAHHWEAHRKYSPEQVAVMRGEREGLLKSLPDLNRQLSTFQGTLARLTKAWEEAQKKIAPIKKEYGYNFYLPGPGDDVKPPVYSHGR